MRLISTIAPLFLVFSLFAQSKPDLVRLTEELEIVYKNDQEPRLYIDSLVSKYGFNSNEVKNQWQIISKNDSINTAIVVRILDQYGWLGERETSKSANAALFYVVQHASLPVQIKYLPVLKNAVELGKAKGSQLALLLDRTNMRQGKLQVYGTQVTRSSSGGAYFFPIADEPNVNVRRNEIGLPPLEDYAQQFGIQYSVSKIDSLKEKFVIVGFVIDKDQKPVADVSVFIENKVMAVTDSYGVYKVVLGKARGEQNVAFIKEGYAISELPIERKDRDVVELHIMLNR